MDRLVEFKPLSLFDQIMVWFLQSGLYPSRQKRWPQTVYDVSAHGTFSHDCIVEYLRLIFTPVGVEDDEKTYNDEGAC